MKRFRTIVYAAGLTWSACSACPSDTKTAATASRFRARSGTETPAAMLSDLEPPLGARPSEWAVSPNAPVHEGRSSVPIEPFPGMAPGNLPAMMRSDVDESPPDGRIVIERQPAPAPVEP